MHITLDCSKDNFTFSAGVISGLHKVFQIGNSSFHCFRRLEHERQLHLTGTEEFTNRFHAAQKVLINNFNG